MRYLSLFSGVEAASVAWHPLGWECVGVAEIEPFPCAVLAHHYPDVPNLGSVTDITDERIAALGPIDLVVGGSPCQDLSVAGKRAGLAGERSGLFSEQMRIFHAARRLCGARWLLWENVPGAFSSNRGRDFAAVAGEMAGCEFGTPGRWQTAGAALGPAGLVEWRVLDAQYFGLAQRRKRVFALLDTGDWASRPPVLLEPQSVLGDSAPRREAGEGVAASVIKGAAVGRKPENGPQFGEHLTDGSSYTLNCTEVHAVAHALSASHGAFDATAFHPTQDPISGPVCHSLSANSNATAAVAIRTANTSANGHGVSPECDHTPDQAQGQALAYGLTTEQTPKYAEDLALTMTRQSPTGGGQPQAVAFSQNQRNEVRLMGVAGALAAEPGAKQQRYTMQGMSVRRLTPTECERLQGFPDDWTRIPYRNKPADQCPDGPRYKALGNSMAVPVMRWIGQRIQEAAKSATQEAAA